MYFRFSLQLLTVASIILCTSEAKRSVKCVVYPDSEDMKNKTFLNIVHVMATNDQDTIHYLFSSFKFPSLIVLRTTKNSELKIDFEKLRLFQKGAITFSEEPFASTGFKISELWQNSYNSSTAEMYDTSSIISLDLESFSWKNVTNSSISCSDKLAVIRFVSFGDNDIFSKGGSFQIEFSVSAVEEAATDYPHLMYTGNSTQIKTVFDNFYSNSSRVHYAMELSVFAPLSKNCSHNDCKIVVTKSVSDEFSPGTFSDFTLLPPCSSESFLSWRPVAYTSKEPNVANSTDAKITSQCSKSLIIKPQSIAELFFIAEENFSTDAFNITFGTKGDGFYPKTKYTMWSIMAGVGTSVGFKLSGTAIIVASIGMATLMLFLLYGFVFIGVQKCRKKDDELLLDTNEIN